MGVADFLEDYLTSPSRRFAFFSPLVGGARLCFFYDPGCSLILEEDFLPRRDTTRIAILPLP